MISGRIAEFNALQCDNFEEYCRLVKERKEQYSYWFEHQISMYETIEKETHGRFTDAAILHQMSMPYHKYLENHLLLNHQVSRVLDLLDTCPRLTPVLNEAPRLKCFY